MRASSRVHEGDKGKLTRGLSILLGGRPVALPPFGMGLHILGRSRAPDGMAPELAAAGTPVLIFLSEDDLVTAWSLASARREAGEGPSALQAPRSPDRSTLVSR